MQNNERPPDGQSELGRGVHVLLSDQPGDKKGPELDSEEFNEKEIYSGLFLSIVHNTILTYFFHKQLLESHACPGHPGGTLSAYLWIFVLSYLGFSYVFVRDRKPLALSTIFLLFAATVLTIVVLHEALPDAVMGMFVQSFALFVSARNFICICEVVRRQKIIIEMRHVAAAVVLFFIHFAADLLKGTPGRKALLLYLLTYALILLLAHCVIGRPVKGIFTRHALLLLFVYLLVAYTGMCLATAGQALSANFLIIVILRTTTALSLILAYYLGIFSSQEMLRHRLEPIFPLFCLSLLLWASTSLTFLRILE
jgi:hypothetical protein